MKSVRNSQIFLDLFRIQVYGRNVPEICDAQCTISPSVALKGLFPMAAFLGAHQKIAANDSQWETPPLGRSCAICLRLLKLQDVSLRHSHYELWEIYAWVGNIIGRKSRVESRVSCQKLLSRTPGSNFVGQQLSSYKQRFSYEFSYFRIRFHD